MKHGHLFFTLIILSFSLGMTAQTTTATPDPTPAVTPEPTPAATITDTTIPAAPVDPTVTASPDAGTPAVATEPVVEEPKPKKEKKAKSSTPSASEKAQMNAWKKGNLYFGAKAYSEAIPFYEKIMKTDSTNKMLLSNLGDCYRLTNNNNGQLVCYGGLVRQGKAEPIQELYYGQALVEAGQPEQAKTYFDKYAADSRGPNLASSVAKMKTYSRNADAFSITPVAYNSPQNDMCAVLFHDAVVFSSSRTKTEWINKQQGWTEGGYMKVYATEKDENGKDMTPSIFMGDLNSKYNDGPICFSKDFNYVYFTRNNASKAEMAKDNTYKLKILEATMDENGFSMVKPLPFNNNDYNFAHPAISADGYVMYFSSDMEGGKGGMDIYMSRKDSGGVWGTPVNMGDKINTAGNEVFPFVATNGILYFSSNGLDGLGGLDI